MGLYSGGGVYNKTGQPDNQASGFQMPSAGPAGIGLQFALGRPRSEQLYQANRAYRPSASAADQLLIGQLQAGQTRQRQRYDLGQGDYDARQAYANRGYGFETGGLDVKGGALGRDRSFADEYQQSLERGFGSEDAFLRAIQASKQREFGLAETDIRNETDIANRQQSSDATARGATTAQGTALGFADIGRRRDSSLSKIGEQRSQQDATYTRSLADLDEGRIRSRLEHKKTIGGLDDAAKLLGIDRRRLKADLDESLRKIGLDRKMAGFDWEDILQGNSNDIAALLAQLGMSGGGSRPGSGGIPAAASPYRRRASGKATVR